MLRSRENYWGRSWSGLRNRVWIIWDGYVFPMIDAQKSIQYCYKFMSNHDWADWTSFIESRMCRRLTIWVPPKNQVYPPKVILFQICHSIERVDRRCWESSNHTMTNRTDHRWSTGKSLSICSVTFAHSMSDIKNPRMFLIQEGKQKYVDDHN
jgi:hypothetical protein